MKKLCLTLRFVLAAFTLEVCTLGAIGQTNNFASVGAEWWYDHAYMSSSTEDFIHAHVDNDTIIQGRTCGIITYDQQVDCWIVSKTYVFEDSGRVYQFNFDSSQFYLQWDFNLAKGDSFDFFSFNEGPYSGLYMAYVDSIDSVLVGSTMLKRMFVLGTDSFGYHWSFAVLEDIGPYVLISLYTWGECMNGSIRCYSDTTLGLCHFFGLQFACDSIVNVIAETIIESTEIVICSPLQSEIAKFSLRNFTAGDYKFKVLNLLGQEIISREIKITKATQDEEITLIGLETSLYFVNLCSNQLNFTQKFYH